VSLSNLLLFERLSPDSKLRVVENMWLKDVRPGEILIQEGEVGIAASELYVVKAGSFEVRWSAEASRRIACILM